MRNAFADEITMLADRDSRIVLLSGDIGNRLFDGFKSRHPDRFYNVGVAEADMIGIAAGMALAGMRPVVYTIASFAIYRAFEQIRVDLCYHNLPVVIIGVGSGLGYAANGPTHHSCEDLAVLRSLPNMTVLCPCDAWELRSLLNASLQLTGPVYLRIGKKGEPAVYTSRPSLSIGRGFELRAGSEVAFLCAGTLMPQVLAAADQLEASRIRASVYSMHSVKPLDCELLEHVLRSYRLVVTIEEHSLIGGLGSAVADWMADHPAEDRRLLRLGTPDAFLHHSGEQEHAREMAGLTIATIVERVHSTWSALQV